MRLRHFVTTIMLFIIGLPMVNAQLPDGSIAPDWTLTDLNGVTHNLYSYLNAGKSVVIDFSATWCGPCWNYHTGGTLETLWEDYGPDGTDEIMVFFLEGDTGTNDACLYGDVVNCSESTQGDWVTGTGYPIINIPPSQSSVVSAYQISYWPTLYAICADSKKTYEAGQTTVSGWESYLFSSCPMDASYISQDAICFETGSIDVTPQLGYGNLSYEWNSGQNTQDLEDIGPGTYSVTITDSNNHSIDIQGIVIGGTDVPLEADLNNMVLNDCYGDTNGSLSVSPVNGTPPFSYTWSNGGNGAQINNLPAGYYEVTVTDANQCEGTNAFMLEDPEELDLFVDPINATCGEENGEMHLQGLGGTGNSYQYDIGFGYFYYEDYYDLPPGDYDVSVMDENGCEFFTSATIVGGLLPVADAGDDAQLDCDFPEIELDGSNSSSGPNIDYYWSTTDGNIVSGGNTPYPVVDAPGTYDLMVYDFVDDCTVYDQVIVTSIILQPTLQVAEPEMVTCTSPTVVLDASGSDEGEDFDVSWSTTDGNIVDGGNTLMPSVDAAGTYTLTITNYNNGCSSSEEVVVESDTVEPSFTVEDEEITCAAPQVEICVTPLGNVDNVVWTDGEEGLCRTVTVAGTYAFTAEGSNGCTKDGEIVVSMDADVPTASAGEDQTLTCTVTTVTLDGSASSTGDIYTYEWTDMDGNVLGTEAQLDVTVPGTYNLLVSNTENGCAVSDQVVVDEFINTADPSFTSELDYNILNLNSASSDPDATSTWTSSDGQSADGFEAVFTFMQSGDYEICHAVTNECGTESTCETVTVTILPLTFDATVISLTCPDSQDGSIAVTPGGGIADYEVEWNGPDGYTSEAFEIDGLSAGNYEMTLTDAAGTTLNETFVVTQPDPFVVTSDVTDEIDSNTNGAIDVTITGGTPPYSYEWSNGMDTEDLADLPAGDYTLVVTDANGCTITVTITVDMRTNSLDLPFVEHFSVSPNPAFNAVNVDVQFEKAIEGKLVLINKLGQIIQIEKLNALNQKVNLDISGLRSGIYFIRLETEEGSIARKVVKL